MPGYEYLRIGNTGDPNHDFHYYAKKLTPSGGGTRVATSKEVKPP